MADSKITTLLMFAGQAEEAMNFYASVFDQAKIHTVHVPLSSTPISNSFGWVSDRYGVSWQLNLRKA